MADVSMGASMQRMPAVSRPAWMLARKTALSGAGGGQRRSPVEIIATMGTFMTRTQAAEVSGLRAGPSVLVLATLAAGKDRRARRVGVTG
ncbi:MAG: hypothetical protein ACRDOB_21705 [Streptosporangiaceae bacterium]